MDDLSYMRLALDQAQLAYDQDEVPVGAVLVDKNGVLLASAYNQVISLHDPSAHAEVQVMRKASVQLQNYRLVDTTLFVSLEPCMMCYGAMVHARIKRLVYATPEPKAGVVTSQLKVPSLNFLNHKISVDCGPMGDESRALLQQFFAKKRLNKKS